MENGIARLDMLVELVRSTEDIVSLGQGHADDHQPVAAECG